MKNYFMQLGACALLIGLLTSTGWGQYKDLYRAGQTRQRAGQYAEARQNFAEARELATNGVERAAAQIAIGLAYAAQQNYGSARTEFEKVLAIADITPDQKAQAHWGIGTGYYWEKKYPAARAELEKVLELKDASDTYKVQAQMFVGHSFGNENDKLAEAQTAYAKVLDMPGASPAQKVEARMAVVGTLIKMQRYPDARTELQAVLATRDLPPVSRARTQLSLGKIFLLEQNYTAARTELAKALAIEGITGGDKVEAQLRVGLSYYGEQDYGRAGPELKKVLTMAAASARQTHEATLRLRLRKLIPGDEKMLAVLFIGASQTQVLNVPQIVETLAASAPAGKPRIIADGFLRGGTGIQKFWEEGEGPGTARAAVMADPWNCVVFETHPLLFGNDIFVKYATKFADLIRSNNATPVFFEAPAFFRHSYPDDFQKIHDETVVLGKKLGVPVAAADYAWMKYLGPNPTPEQRMDLYHPDAVHPSKKGAYLIACSIYSAITGLSPVGLTHDIPTFGSNGISKAEAAACQESAWQAFQETNPGLKPSP